MVKHDQEHVLRFWDELGQDGVASAEQRSLYEELKDIKYEELMRFFKTCTDEMKREEKLDDELEPLPDEVVGSFARTNAKQLAKYELEGNMWFSVYVLWYGWC